MSVDKSSLSTKVGHDEPSQADNNTINNQDIKKEDLNEKSSPKVQLAQESNQTTTLDANKNDNSSSNENSSSPPDAQTTTNPDSDANKHDTEISSHESQIPDSDNANKQTNMISTHDSQKSSTTMVPTSNLDANSVERTNPPTANEDNKKSTNHSTQTASNELETTNKDDHGNPLPTDETSTSQIPDSHTNNQANANTTHDSPKISTTTVPTLNQEPPTPDNDAKKDTNQSTPNDEQTNKDNQVNQIPTDESSTSHITNLDANKQAGDIITDDSPKTSTSVVPTSNQDPNSVDQANTATADSKTKQDTNQSPQTVSTDSETEKKTPPSEIAPKEDRTHLENLIGQELKFLKKICPRLGEHEKQIKKDAEKASERYKKLKEENCDLKELKALKKTVTKLKLQIPARYMRYDETDKQKNQQSDVENRDSIPSKLQKKMPRLHNKIFNESPICKTIHLRFNQLDRELKLCLLCFSVFPENAIISRRLMIYWWIGEGLIPREDDDAEDCANNYFIELMNQDFIESVSRSYGRHVPACKMNPMVRAALIMIADKVRFFDFDAYGNPKDLGKFDEIESPEDLPNVYPLGEPREFFDFFDKTGEGISDPINFVDSDGNPCQFAVRPDNPNTGPVNRDGKLVDRNGKEIAKAHYLYLKKKITTKSHKVCLMGSGLSKGIPWENLHILFNVKENILEFKPEWFLRMKNINILFLGRWQTSAAHHIEVEDFEFEKGLGNMNHVRFFSLQGVSRIDKLPVSISKLKSLLILDLRACHDLEIIPETIGSLKFLTHLDMSECYLLKKIPKEISFLECLQVLKGFVVVESSRRDICTLQDLKTLKNLKKLSMYTHMKNFPQDSHLEALQKLEQLSKLTILWGGREPNTENEPNTKIEPNTESKPNTESEPKPQTTTPKQDPGQKKSLASKVMRLVHKKEKSVEGSLRRMDAFNNSGFYLRLEKLDLKCFPRRPDTPNWLTARNFRGLKKLYIRGGNFSDLGQYDEVLDWDDLDITPKVTWDVEILRLKYLEELNMEWRELRNMFPKLTSLEKVKCPRLTLFPCNEQGVWMKKGSMAT